MTNNHDDDPGEGWRKKQRLYGTTSPAAAWQRIKMNHDLKTDFHCRFGPFKKSGFLMVKVFGGN